MPTPRRRLVRESLLALLVSYLREGVTTTGNFTLLPLVSNRYPFTQGVWTFAHGGNLWQLTMIEQGQPVTLPGVTLEFARDDARPAKAMPQEWELSLRIHVRIPRNLNSENTAQEIAEKIDECLHRAAGRCDIKDYETEPPTDTRYILSWQRTERGDWQDEGDARMAALVLTKQMRYSTPGL